MMRCLLIGYQNDLPMALCWAKWMVGLNPTSRKSIVGRDGLEILFSTVLEFTRNASSMDYNFIGENCRQVEKTSEFTAG